MSIEQILIDLTEALKEHAALLREYLEAENKKATEAEARKPKVQAEAPKVQAEAPKVQAEAPKVQEKPAVAYEDVKAAVYELLAAKSRDAVVGLLKKFGVSTAKDLPEAQWAEFITAARREIGEK